MFMCFLALCKTAAVVGPVWNDSEIVIGEGGGYSDETIGAAGWLREVRLDVEVVKTLWGKLERSGKSALKIRELCIWDMDGERVVPAMSR
jgi:hypothetical protein